MWLVGEHQKAMKEAKSGWPEAERKIARLRHEVTREYRFIVEAVRTVQEEIERREPGRQRHQQIEERIRGLKFRTNADSLIHMKVGEVKEIWFWIEKGAPQYEINVHRPEKDDFFPLTQAERAGPIMLPFSFGAPGRYVRHLQVVDSYAEKATVTLTFVVSEADEPPPPSRRPARNPHPPKPNRQRNRRLRNLRRVLHRKANPQCQLAASMRGCGMWLRRISLNIEIESSIRPSCSRSNRMGRFLEKRTTTFLKTCWTRVG